MEKNEVEYELKVSDSYSNASLKIKKERSRVLATIGDITIDCLSYFRWKNAVKFLDKYNEKKRQRGIEGKETPLPPKFLLEILNNGFQENDEDLQNNWNNLLINWQDVEKQCDKRYMYIDILKNLCVNEIRLLKCIKDSPDFHDAFRNQAYYYDSNKIKKALSLSDEEYEIMMLNLFRLKIFDSIKSDGNAIAIGDLSVHADGGIDKVRLTIIGYNLIINIEE